MIQAPYNFSLICLLQKSGCGCGMMTIIMMMVIIGTMVMKINFLNGTMVLKNGSKSLNKGRALIHCLENIKIVELVCSKMKNKKQKNCGRKCRPFCV